MAAFTNRATISWGDTIRDSNVVTGEIEFTHDKIEGNIGTDVINEKVIVLPETGGIGTTIFYIVGALLVVGAAIVLITKKRMGTVNS